MEKKNKSQAERLTEALINISADVTTEDRNAAMDKYGVSQPTISRYLNGDGKDVDTAFKLYTFLVKRINSREILIPAA